MEIMLEKIELVKDRTGVSYKEAKEALEAADGSVVDAIINIEERLDEHERVKFNDYANSVVEKLKEIIKKGNVSKISVKKDGETLLNLPLNIGILGTVLAPFAMIAGLIAAFGTKCVIEVVKDDGSIIDVSEMASGTADYVAEKGTFIASEIKTKSGDIFETVKEKSGDVYEVVKDKSGDVFETVKEKSAEAYEVVKEKTEDVIEKTRKEKESDVFDENPCCCDEAGESCCCDEAGSDCCCDETNENCCCEEPVADGDCCKEKTE